MGCVLVLGKRRVQTDTQGLLDRESVKVGMVYQLG